MNTKEIKISEYDYELPEERIAKYPAKERDTSKLLVYRSGDLSTDVFRNVAEYLSAEELLVFNNAKVIQARLHFRKPTGAAIEIFLLEPHSPSDYESVFSSKGECVWQCLVGNLKKWKDGTLSLQANVGGVPVEVVAHQLEHNDAGVVVKFTWNPAAVSFAELLDAVGELPIPPYLNRATEESDTNTYQTVYSKIKGSVAAPTAGLHFTERVLADIHGKGIDTDEVTLHVGAGTFKPVKSDSIGEHKMHSEVFAVKRSTVERILSHGCRVAAIGTTSVRTIESLYYIGLAILRNPNISPDAIHVGQWTPYEASDSVLPKDAMKAILDWMERNGLTVLNASTQIIIADGYRYKYVKRLITNFHQPHSTLLLLISAFVGGDWRSIYDYALANDFRFLSYGDSSILIP